MNDDISESTFVVSERSNFNFSQRLKKDCIRSICVSEFSREWERNILNLIPHRDRRKHSSFIKFVLNEIKVMYVESMKDHVLKSTLSSEVYEREPVPCEECDLTSSPWARNVLEDGIAYDRATFLRRRRAFAARYFLSSPTVRHVVNTAHRILPTVICDFRRYRDHGTLTLSEFREMILRDARRANAVIANQFYTETCRAVEKSGTPRDVSRKQLSQFMRCLTNVFVQQILDVMMRSINHVIRATRDGRYCPRIEFRLVCENDRLTTEPSVEKVLSTYHDVIGHIEGIAQDLMPLEQWLEEEDVGVKERYIRVSLPEWFIESSRRSLREILDELFRPVNEHVESISAEFGGVYTPSVNRPLASSSGSGQQPDFDAHLARIHRYNEYLAKTNRMLSSLHYEVGELRQTDARESLRRICRDVVDALTIELVNYHREFNRAICLDFEELRSTALDVRKDAQALIRLAEYMSHASKVLMKELEERIRRSIYMLGKLLDITVLSDEHAELNRTTVNWLRDIQPVFSQNNNLCEAMKSELEEDLQRRINTLNAEVDAMFPRLVILDDMDDMNGVGDYAERYKSLIKMYERLNDEMETINAEEKLFKFPETEFPKIIELKETIVPFYTLIRTVHRWRRDHSVWLNGPFECLDATVIETKINRYCDEIAEMGRNIKARIKMDATANKSFKFSGVADDPDPMQQPAPLRLCWQALNSVNEFKVYLPLAVCMCNPALTTRHWRQMSGIRDLDLTPNAGTTLRKMIDMNLMDDIDEYRAISLGANKELRLQRELAAMANEWRPISFAMDEESGVMVFEHADDIETLLREHLVRIEEMRASHFVRPILDDVVDFLSVLTRIQETLDRWTRVQLCKRHLQPIFCYPRIETRLSEETSLYLEATGILSRIGDRFAENPTFEKIKKSSDLLEILNEADEKLERAAKGVRNYLDAKKLSFARFFFLEDSEIQQILFESVDVAKRHRLANKCFAGVKRLKLNRSNCIRGVVGLYGETLRLTGSISIDTEREENWLIQLERELRDAVCQSVSRYHLSIDAGNLTFDESVDDFPSMAIVCGSHLYWTSSVEKCFVARSATLDSLSATYANVISSTITELRSKKSTRRRRNLLMSLIIITSSHREIVRLLLEKNAGRTDFEWIAQLRYYRRDDENVVRVSTFDVTIEYGYEYAYYRQTIVNTPLTDRCFRTILQAYRYHLYGALVGPTSTGKTETIRSLTSSLAKLCHVVNCSNGVSYTSLTQVFKGMILCGAWICLENFAGLRAELLSAVAQTLTQIRQAVSSGSRTVNLEGRDLHLNVTGNVCATVDSTRAIVDLPDNLKIFFRSVSMTVPDVGRIAEVELFAGGFLHSKNLAVTLTVGYKLLSECLGGADRVYNFSASSLKTVVAAAIGMKRACPDADEYTLLLRSMVDVNVPQLRNVDVPIFQSVVRSVFPFGESVALPFDCVDIRRALETVCAERRLTLHSTFKLKAIQIIEMMHVRRGLVLVGDPLTGKTEILRALAETLSVLRDKNKQAKIGATVTIETITPGVVDNDALFGCFGRDGGWRDGLCSAIFRRYAADDAPTRHREWLVFDGTVSDGSSWMENLYTALDENGTLHLISGERIPVRESTSVVFETTDTAEISPGVISRCGMIYVDSRSIGWRPYVLSHIASR